VVTWMIIVESSVLVQQIALGHQTAVNVAGFQINGRLALMLDMKDFFAGYFTEGAMKY
jgi:hypothetical protein